jgi:hypothetical protein
MPKLVSLGLKVGCVVLVDRRDDRDLIDDRQIKSAQVERFRLLRVIGQQPNLGEPEIF